eukprot:1836206-Rhodomonas_salina.1
MGAQPHAITTRGDPDAKRDENTIDSGAKRRGAGAEKADTPFLPLQRRGHLRYAPMQISAMSVMLLCAPPLCPLCSYALRCNIRYAPMRVFPSISFSDIQRMTLGDLACRTRTVSGSNRAYHASS